MTQTESTEAEAAGQQEELFALYASATTRGVWLPWVLIAACGDDITAALLLQQIVYWRRKMGQEFYKHHDDWYEEIAMNPEQVRYNGKKLKKLGFVSTRRGHDHANKVVTYYDVEAEALGRAIRENLPDGCGK